MDILNINSFHSSSLELMIEAAFMAVILWILIGFFLVYNAQSQMKSWYGLEVYAHDAAQLDKLNKTYEKIYAKYKAVGSI